MVEVTVSLDSGFNMAVILPKEDDRKVNSVDRVNTVCQDLSFQILMIITVCIVH